MKPILTLLLLLSLRLCATDKAYTVAVSETVVPFTNSVAIPKFLPTYGQLTNILISVEYMNSITAVQLCPKCLQRSTM